MPNETFGIVTEVGTQTL